MPTPGPPGTLVSLDTHRLHLLCTGHGSPTVVFDAALGASSLSWTFVHPPVARFTRACVYDRAGFGWSDGGPMPRTAGRIADELHLLLQRAAVPPPFVLVGHSFGGLVARLFAARHREEVAGLVLVEPAIPEEWGTPSTERQRLIERGARLCRVGAVTARLGIARIVARLARAGAHGAAWALVRAVSRGGLGRQDEGILGPIWKLPPEVRATLGARWTQPKFFEALGSQIATVCDSAAEVQREASTSYGSLPLTVVSARASSEARLAADEALSRLSTHGRHILADDSGHWIPLDAPVVVVDAVREMVTHVRTSSREVRDLQL
jgi:pimeloyl-ACP methyl ester carboxylesterase